MAHRIPYPPNKGDKIRAYHEVRGLSERGHEVHVLAFADAPDDLAAAGGLLPYCASVVVLPLDVPKAKARSLLALAGDGSLSLAYYRVAAMERSVGDAVARLAPDAWVAYSSVMSQYVPPGLRQRAVMDLVDVDSEKWRDYSLSHRWPMSSIYRIEARRLRRHELQVVRSFGASILATAREAELIRGDLDGPAATRLHSVVNGVDTEYFRPNVAQQIERTASERERQGQPDRRPRIVFTGAMDYEPNVEAVGWFAREAFPRIRQVRPDAVFQIVGSRPASAVRELASLPGVQVTGFVDDVRPYLWGASVCVIPLKIARGIQNKLLEAMACGRPVVATPDAVAAVAVRDGEEVVVAERTQFADAVLGLLTRPDQASHLEKLARQFVERDHSWSHMLGRFCGLVERTACVGEA